MANRIRIACTCSTIAKVMYVIIHVHYIITHYGIGGRQTPKEAGKDET